MMKNLLKVKNKHYYCIIAKVLVSKPTTNTLGILV